MADAYSQIVNNPVGGFVAKNLGLPQPVELDRWQQGAPLIAGRVLAGSAPGGRCGDAVAAVLADAGAAVDSRLDDEVRAALGGGRTGRMSATTRQLPRAGRPRARIEPAFACGAYRPYPRERLELERIARHRVLTPRRGAR